MCAASVMSAGITSAKSAKTKKRKKQVEESNVLVIVSCRQEGNLRFANMLFFLLFLNGGEAMI